MFVAPAIFASACDAIVLFMASKPPDEKEKDEIASHGWVQSSHYLSILAIIRLVLLFGPLSYHTYRGTRVKCQRLYFFLHCATVTIIVVHMLCIIMLDPDSLGSLLPIPLGSGLGLIIDGVVGPGGEDSNHAAGRKRRLTASAASGALRRTLDEAMSSVASSQDGTDLSTHSASMRHIWIILSFSFLSTALHIIILLHVRSTAPSSTAMINERERGKKKMLAYYAYRRYYGSSEAFHGRNGATGLLNGGITAVMKKSSGTYEYNSIPADEGPHHQITPESSYSSIEGDNEQGIFRNEESHGEEGGQIGAEDLIRRNDSFGSAFGGRYDEFMSDLQSRLDFARRQWSARLEDVTRSIQNQLGAEDLQVGPRSPSNWSGPAGHIPFLHLSPFRALLQLYAYEDVFTNHKLERAFHSDCADTSDALVFYSPQLLSFLLHGAFLDSPRLEQWILDNCRKNMHFAHRCFWFLRAWCLGRGAHSHGGDGSESNMHERNQSLSSLDNRVDVTAEKSNGPSSSKSLTRRHGSEPNLYLEATPEKDADSAHLHKPDSSSKFPQEEHNVIEELLFKVIECGEAAASPLQYGPLASPHDNNPLSAMPALNAVELGMLPVDSGSGQLSETHLATLQAREKFGFLPPSGRPNGDHDTMTPSNEGDGLFLAAPRFLDALTSIADDLMLEEKASRTVELRRRLRSLEIELLPSNVVYVPVNNVQHRVWRIAVDESVALSTNERVPCIICLEVIAYDEPDEDTTGSLPSSVPVTDDNAPSSPASARAKLVAANAAAATRKFLANSSLHAATKSERDVLVSWYKNPRPAQRHNTIMEKVSTYTRKLRHDIGDTLHHQNEKIFWNLEGNSRLLPGSGTVDVDLETGPATNGSLGGSSHARNDAPILNEDKLVPRPPLPPVRTSSQSAPMTPSTPDHSISQPSSRASSRPSSPTTAMGQWHSPVPSGKKRLAMELHDLRQSLERDTEGERSRDQGDSAFMTTLQMPCIDDSSKDRIVSSEEDQLPVSARIKAWGPGSDTPLVVTQEGHHQADQNLKKEKKKKRSRPPPVVFKEDWSAKEERIRNQSAFGSDPRWRLLPILIKSNDDLRQEQLAAQLIHRMASILARAKVPVWLYPYEILALTDRGGIIEAIPDTISIDSLKKNDPNYVDLRTFFDKHFGPPGCDEHANAKANFVESLAAYSIVCYLLQIKDRHNGNILLTNKGHIVHIDFGFFFLSSPGKNSGFESAPFKLTRDFVDVMDGPDSRTFVKFRELCCKTFLELRRHCYQIILLVEMLVDGGEDLQCFRGRPEEAIEGLRERFRLDLNDRACVEYVNGLVDESCGNWRTVFYDRYQRLCVGVL